MGIEGYKRTINDPMEKPEKKSEDMDNRLEDMQTQIRLATEVYTRINGFSDPEDTENGNKIMTFWTDKINGEDSYSSIYREMLNDESFMSSPDIKGDITRITADHISSYKEGKDGQIAA